RLDAIAILRRATDAHAHPRLLEHLALVITDRRRGDGQRRAVRAVEHRDGFVDRVLGLAANREPAVRRQELEIVALLQELGRAARERELKPLVQMLARALERIFRVARAQMHDALYRR